jgi:acetylglutamate/LysW-gamma-L-alpha-aminoadipate kinase
MEKLVVVKVGGSEGIDLEAICEDVAGLRANNTQLVLIHGGSHETNEVAEALGHPSRFITSPTGYTSRLTDRRTLEIFEMVYCGRINKAIVEKLQGRGVNAIGLSGLDGRIWSGPRKKAIRILENGRNRIIRDTFTGRVETVNSNLLSMLLEAGMLPVLTPPAISHEGEAINVDGDRAAAATAVALSARQLIILSNVPGVLAKFPDESSLIPAITPEEIEPISKTAAKGRMRIKLLAAQEALSGGVEKIIIGDARRPSPISRTMAGEGTVIHSTANT